MSKLTLDECKSIIMQGKKQLTAAEQRIAELEANNGSRWFDLFGTPERAAWTLAKACGECDEDLPCCECPLYPIIGNNVYEPELIEWLRGDAE